MTTLRRFTCNDLFTFNAVNLDKLTETVRAKTLAGTSAAINRSSLGDH